MLLAATLGIAETKHNQMKPFDGKTAKKHKDNLIPEPPAAGIRYDEVAPFTVTTKIPKTSAPATTPTPTAVLGVGKAEAQVKEAWYENPYQLALTFIISGALIFASLFLFTKYGEHRREGRRKKIAEHKKEAVVNFPGGRSDHQDHDIFSVH